MARTRTVTLSSVGTATMILDPDKKSTTLLLTASATSSGNFQVDISLDDPSIYMSSGTVTMTWGMLSSAAGIASSTLTTAPLVWTVMSPISAVRINSSTSAGGEVLTLKALQSITA